MHSEAGSGIATCWLLPSLIKCLITAHCRIRKHSLSPLHVQALPRPAPPARSSCPASPCTSTSWCRTRTAASATWAAWAAAAAMCPRASTVSKAFLQLCLYSAAVCRAWRTFVKPFHSSSDCMHFRPDDPGLQRLYQPRRALRLCHRSLGCATPPCRMLMKRCVNALSNLHVHMYAEPPDGQLNVRSSTL